MSTVVLRRGQPIPVNAVERAVGKWIGESRNRAAQAQGGDHSSYDGRDALEINIGGATAELAIAKVLNLYPDFQFDGDRGYDLKLDTGETIDVKWNCCYADLVVSLTKQEKPCDLYLLVCGVLDQFSFGGWAPRDRIITPAAIRNLGHGPCFVQRSHALTATFTLAVGRRS